MMRKLRKPMMLFGAAGMLVGLGGCCTFCGELKDINYGWDIPSSNAQCDPNSENAYVYKDAVPFSPDLDGGPGIVDRDAGPGIVDRDGDYVTRYCLKVCPGGTTEAGPPIIDFHNTTNFVRAERRCE